MKIKDDEMLDIYGGALKIVSMYFIREYIQKLRKLNDIFGFWKR